ncbi:MAG: y4mF family transcriptional regulator [Bacteroidia bacterium]|jgi:y4mF family transcriptional regulator
MNSSKFGIIVRNRRKALDLTQADLSLATGIGIRYISDLERGKPTCELERALKIVAALGLKAELSERR